MMLSLIHLNPSHTCSSTFPLLTKPLWATGDLSVNFVCYKTARLPGHRPMVRLFCACFHTSQDDELQPPTPPTRTNTAQCINHCNLRKGTSTPLAHMVVITGWLVLVTSTPCTGGGVIQCNLPWWSFSFHPLAHILYLQSSNLHSVVVVVVCGCGGGACSYGMVVVQWQ